MEIEPGTVVANRYRISRPLGRGGMGEVFAADNIRTGRHVAVKLLHADAKTKASSIGRFQREARAAGSINSDYVTQVLDVEDDPQYGIVLVFELLEGESLIERLKRAGPVPFEELHPLIEQVWIGLVDAHRAGIIHRDLKPSNVFLERRPDGTTRAKILDFGISKVPKDLDGATLTEVGQSLGTFSFMPPEQIGKAKSVDLRADIYACATLIYQSLTGQLPFPARNVVILIEMKKNSNPRTLAEASGGTFDPRLEAFVARALARDPNHRFQSAVDALAAWREIRPQARAENRSPSQGYPPAAPAVAADPAPTRVEGYVRPPLDSGTDDTAATIALPIERLRGARTPSGQLDPRVIAYQKDIDLRTTVPIGQAPSALRDSPVAAQSPVPAAMAPGAPEQGFVRHTPPPYDGRFQPPAHAGGSGYPAAHGAPPAGHAPPVVGHGAPPAGHAPPVVGHGAPPAGHAPTPVPHGASPTGHAPSAAPHSPSAGGFAPAHGSHPPGPFHHPPQHAPQESPVVAAPARKPATIVWVMAVIAMVLLGFAIVAIVYNLRLR